MENVLEDHLKGVRKRFTALLDERLDELEDLREKIGLNAKQDEAYRKIQFIAHKIAGTAGMLGFEDLGKLASSAENTIIQHVDGGLSRETHKITVKNIDVFIECAADISSKVYWETA